MADFFIDWFPMVLLVVIWLFFLWRMGSFKNGSILNYYKNQAEQTLQLQRQTELLERIAKALEKDSPH